MSASVRWSPEMQTIIEWLTHADGLVRADAYAAVREETEAAARELASRWPRKSGRMVRSIRTEFPSETVILGKVRATSPAAHLNFGTQQRKTSKGWNRGRMPDSDVLVTVARAHRGRLAQRLRAVVERHGFTIKG